MFTRDGQCPPSEAFPAKMPSAILNGQIDYDVLLFYLKLTLAALRSAVEYTLNHKLDLILYVMLILFLYIIYKSYWNPILYVKELTDVGFNDIPKGENRDKLIARAMSARQIGDRLYPPYPNGWFALVESSELKKGKVVSVDALGQNFAVYRGDDGIARCVDAYCPHLGANLGVGGLVEGGCIECPFHKWRFDSGGVCVNVPGLDSPPKGISIKTWPTTEAAGAVWVWHDVEGRSPLWSVVSPEEEEETNRWGYRGRNDFVVGSHVMDIPENGADVGHLNSVHGPSVLTNLGNKYPFLLNIVGYHAWSGEWNRTEEKHMAEMTLTQGYKIGGYNFFHVDVVVHQRGPGHARIRVETIFGPVLISQSVTPTGVLQQKVVHRVYSPWYNAVLGAALVPAESYMFERDITIWNRKRYMSSPAYVKTDKSIRVFRNWYSQFYSENSVSFKDAKQRSLDW